MPWANIIRIGWGLGFLVAAGFNLIYTLQADLEPFWEWFRENAWFTVYKDMLENIVIPNGSVIVVLTVVYVSVALQFDVRAWDPQVIGPKLKCKGSNHPWIRELP